MSTKKYDVFISFKSTKLSNSNQKTYDYEIAKRLFDKLRSKNINVFFSEKDTHDLSSKKEMYEALDEATVLIVVGTNEKYINSEWVKREWESFDNDILNGKKPNGKLFSYIDKIEKEDLPRTLRESPFYTVREIDKLVSDVKQHLDEVRARSTQDDVFWRKFSLLITFIIVLYIVLYLIFRLFLC